MVKTIVRKANSNFTGFSIDHPHPHPPPAHFLLPLSVSKEVNCMDSISTLLPIYCLKFLILSKQKVGSMMQQCWQSQAFTTDFKYKKNSQLLLKKFHRKS